VYPFSLHCPSQIGGVSSLHVQRTGFTNPIDEEMRQMDAKKEIENVASDAAQSAFVGSPGVGVAKGKREITKSSRVPKTALSTSTNSARATSFRSRVPARQRRNELQDSKRQLRNRWSGNDVQLPVTNGRFQVTPPA
jgi:hypothetical protein